MPPCGRPMRWRTRRRTSTSSCGRASTRWAWHIPSWTRKYSGAWPAPWRSGCGRPTPNSAPWKNRSARLERREPGGMLGVAPLDDVEEGGLQVAGDRPRLAGADGAVVHFADRRQLGGRAGHEHLVGDVELVAGEPFLHHL